MFIEEYKMNRQVTLREVGSHIICFLCGGYYVDATTIVECIHSFCRSCIVKHLERSLYCPICEVMVDKSAPLNNLRSDPLLQNITNKLVPNLLIDEINRKRKFYAESPGSKEIDDIIYMIRMLSNNTNAIRVIICNCQEPTIRWDLQCSSEMPLKYLEKLVIGKFGLDSRRYIVEFMLEYQRLHEDLTILQISYLDSNRTSVNSCLNLMYTILKIVKPPKIKHSHNAITESVPPSSTQTTSADQEIQLAITEGGVMSMSVSSSQNLDWTTGIITSSFQPQQQTQTLPSPKSSPEYVTILELPTPETTTTSENSSPVISAPTPTKSNSSPVSTESIATPSSSRITPAIVSPKSKPLPISAKSKSSSIATESTATPISAKSSSIATLSTSTPNSAKSKASSIATESTSTPNSAKSKASSIATESTATPNSAKSKSSSVATESTATNNSAKSKASSIATESTATNNSAKSKSSSVATESTATNNSAKSKSSSVATESTATPNSAKSKSSSVATESTATPNSAKSTSSIAVESTASPSSNKSLLAARLAIKSTASTGVSEKPAHLTGVSVKSISTESTTVSETSASTQATPSATSSHLSDPSHLLSNVNGVQVKQLKIELPRLANNDISNYKTNSPNSPTRSWSPKQQRLRPRLMNKSDESKASKIRRTMPRFLGNPASGVKPMYNNSECQEQTSPSSTATQSSSCFRIDPKTLRPYARSGANDNSTVATSAATPSPSSSSASLVTSPFVPRNNPTILPDPKLSPYSIPPALHSSLPPTVSLPYRNKTHNSKEDSKKT